PFPILFRASVGGGGLVAAQHSQSPYSMFMNVAGLKMFLPSTPYDMKGLLETAIRDNNPVISFESSRLMGKKGEVPEEDYAIPFGQADIKREGSDVTVVALAWLVHEALAAAEELAAEGISVEVVDPRTLVPLDAETIRNSVQKTGRLVIADEAGTTAGFSAEVAAGGTADAAAFARREAPEQGLDTTIVNVCLPHIQGSMSASQNQISWVLTTYIVSSAIMMPLTGWLAGHFGVKYIFLASVVGFTITSALCGAATSLSQLVLYRVLQGVCSAGLVPLGQATLFTIYPREKHGQAMAIFSTGAMMGPILGPTLGGWLTENLDWRWCFYINLPVGALCALGVFIFIRQSRTMRRDEFDMFGFAMLSIAVGSLQLMLDRGQLKDWFHSTEIWIEATVATVCFYLLI